MKLPHLLGRAVFGGFFLYNGIHHFMERKTMAQYVDAKGIPMPDVAVTATGVALTLGGASLVLGIKPELGAGAVAGFLAESLLSCMISGRLKIRSGGEPR